MTDTALFWTFAAVCSACWVAMTLNSYRWWRRGMKIEAELGLPHRWPTFTSFQDEVWKRAVADLRKLWGIRK